ncbi:hypothetical protein J8F10_12775 [Gemmata sp. G18]|uniref:Uncharacterized protein n=1 Tax=Gemmata palustris TaxID=2822762 RepID=A0ABS5BRX1_9BACT|nr:hypothetical protein [Gemmata palustris]MBP3956157.1 hypothetical protein [Gemmata palustris]
MPKPCQGPNCSGKPLRDSMPVPPVPTVPVPVKDQVLRVAAPGGEEQGQLLAYDSTSPRPILRASSIFHPPRLG